MTDEGSPFSRALVPRRRDAGWIDVLQGRVLSRVDPVAGTSRRELSDPAGFFDAVTTVFGRNADDLTPADRAVLWPGCRVPAKPGRRPNGPEAARGDGAVSVAGCRLGACPTPPGGPAPPAAATAP